MLEVLNGLCILPYGRDQLDIFVVVLGIHDGLVDIEEGIRLALMGALIEVTLCLRKLGEVLAADDFVGLDVLIAPLHPVDGSGFFTLTDGHTGIGSGLHKGVGIGTPAFLV